MQDSSAKGGYAVDAVVTHGLEKRFGKRIAVSSFDMHVEAGDIYGLVGQNGAGKSTVLKMICGLTTPTIGDITLFDGASDAPSRIGALIETPGLIPHLNAYHNIAAKALATGIVGYEARCNALLERVGLINASRQKVSTYTLGMKQRLGIALALVGSPDLLLLDEPLNGLDTDGTRDIHDLLVALAEETGMTIIISGHAIDRLSSMITRYGVIKGGTMVRELTAAELAKECESSLHVRTRTPERSVALLLDALPQATLKVQPDNSLLISNCNDEEVAHLLFRSGQEVLELAAQHHDRQTFFSDLMGGDENDD